MMTTTPPTKATKPSYADTPGLFPLDGGCACGHVRYRLLQPPLVVHCCHCTACQRETGTAFAINALIESEHVELLPPTGAEVPGNQAEPEPKPAGPALLASPFTKHSDDTKPNPDKTATDDAPDAKPSSTVCVPTPSESQNPQLIHRCPRCATALWSCYGPNAPRGANLYVRAGTLDKAWAIAPDVHIFVASKRDFITIADDKPQYPAFYAAADVYRPESLDRLAVLLGKLKLGEPASKEK